MHHSVRPRSWTFDE